MKKYKYICKKCGKELKSGEIGLFPHKRIEITENTEEDDLK